MVCPVGEAGVGRGTKQKDGRGTKHAGACGSGEFGRSGETSG